MQSDYKQVPYFLSPNNYGSEGEDHINISIHSKTRLGKILDPGYIKVINYPIIGKFSSVKSLWHWLQSDTRDDKIRKLVCESLVIYARENKLYGKNIPNFKAIMGYATWLKLKEYPDILKELKELPENIVFLSYYTHKANKLRIVNSYGKILIDSVNIIRRALKEDIEPDFSKLVDRGHYSSLSYLHGFLSKYMPEEQLKELCDGVV